MGQESWATPDRLRRAPNPDLPLFTFDVSLFLLLSTMDPDYPLQPSERFLDAALREQARLGAGGRDEEMIHRILQATVHRPVNAVLRRPLVAPNLWDRRSIVVGVGAVAAIVTVGVWVLSSLNYSRRTAQEYQFVVRRIADPVADPAIRPSAIVAQAPLRSLPPGGWMVHAAHPNASPLVGLSPVPGYELIASLGPALTDSAFDTLRQGRLRIIADHQSATDMGIRYEGRVEIEDAEYRIEAQQATLPPLGNVAARSIEDDRDGLDSCLLATEVRVTQISTGRTASAARLRYDLLAGTMELSGLLAFVDREGPTPAWQRGDRLRMTGSEYQIEARPVDAKASFPAP